MIQVEKITREILSLPEKQRAIIAKKIMMSFENTGNYDFEDEWDTEIEKRVDDIKTGKVKTKNADVVFKDITDKLK